MRRRLGVVVLVLVGALTWVASASASPAAWHTPSWGKALTNTDTTATNWAGYAAYGGRRAFTGVSADWTVPQVTCGDNENSYSSFWVGLDGYGSNSVEQIGTDSDCVNGVPTYYAWYEMYPKAPVTIADVSYNDSISASVVATGKGSFDLTISDSTNPLTPSGPATFSKTFRGAKQMSAEAIAEAPGYNPGPFGTVPLTDFGSVTFDSVMAADSNGNSQPIGDYSPNLDDITMVNLAKQDKATVSALNPGGDMFTVDWVMSS